MSFTRADAFELLEKSHRQGRLGHAYLISSDDERAPQALAEQLAGLVVDGGNPLDHPDVHIAGPESKSRRIRIEQTRALERELQMRSLLGGRKVAVLMDADRMTTEAANSFLKTLEEPPNNSLLVLTSSSPETLPETVLSRCIAVPLLREKAIRELSPAQRALADALNAFSQKTATGLADAFGLVQLFIDLLRQAREQIAGEHAAALKTEEVRYRQTTESGAYFDEREDFYKALTESRYIQQRFALVDTLIQWWADVLRQQQGFATLDLPECAAATDGTAQRLSTPETLRRLSALEELRENLNRAGVQEQLAIEVAFLRAFARA